MSDGGIWRTINGRRVFIADGDDLNTAMEKSGKFNDKWDFRGEKELVEKIEKAVDSAKTFKQAVSLRIAIEAQERIIDKLQEEVEKGIENGDMRVLASCRRRLRMAKKKLIEKELLG